MMSQRDQLRKEVEAKERQLATLRNNGEGIKAISTNALNMGEEDDTKKVGLYLVQEGKITLEQNEKVLNNMAIMQMDYLGSCRALGFIDIYTAKEASRITKIKTKTAR